jgi:hypothetical protein
VQLDRTRPEDYSRSSCIAASSRSRFLIPAKGPSRKKGVSRSTAALSSYNLIIISFLHPLLSSRCTALSDRAFSSLPARLSCCCSVPFFCGMILLALCMCHSVSLFLACVCPALWPRVSCVAQLSFRWYSSSNRPVGTGQVFLW